MASDRLQGLGAFFVFGSGLLSLVQDEFLCMSAMLEGAGLLFSGVPTFGKTPGSPGSPEALPTDLEREEGSPSGRKPSSAQIEQRE